ncbi:MAG: hypothetical protein A2268_09740 [Candidatus Raymondbacteria bacterium RifOxyA12_full_50_37]|uniref:Histidine kinase n=1 Tax=Candidatus Raymondbacteria bacterium RIFOXYD12_FULL_49_13 TaxID=1817890 RepID=A0A1F7F1V6_UNCRA|nr:MAG: hypothetical protein A2268_09740 [Candidatus Raymondbacteria bacterium RifOxyA12_full_50_37]OGJ93878.1 MAG: hypothetical protein A2248_06555 [Candidatus Raymondbacteria bacterium RIFOXYA2_FULL_49_16]OGJ98253.1 MAG: hypothetical protein A2453_00610 [Candidatus Raymondbacteria bacterium RIFOXYC2_FULL_50_21]OGK00486.1 MAG: hypothetical protein A2519_10785 [Candidatus Raymondbacteria bacterium RIFOXYD12_FULL_49_13]OGK03863.1 MAG: hypothetical protein A2350_13475 [Candidatus Raymondbacteria 
MLLFSIFLDLFNLFTPIHLIILSIVVAGGVAGVTYLAIFLITSSKDDLTEKSILDSSLTGIFIGTPKFSMGSMLYVNQAMADLFGTTVELLLCDEFLPERYWGHEYQRPEFIQMVKKKKTINSLEIKFRNEQGEFWWGRMSCKFIDATTGTRIQGTLIDITEKKKFEEILTNYNETLQQEISKRTKERDEIQRVSILGLSKITEYRDPETGNHVLRMAHYSKIIARILTHHPKYKGYITDLYVDEIFISAPLHDIGKVGIEDKILKKPGKLTNEEFEIMKFHTIYGGDTLKDIERQLSFQSFLTLGKEIAYNHHQKWDGTGYPNYSPERLPTLGIDGHKALSGEEIPLSARIVALADVYDALTSKRCYRKDAMSHEMAKELILNEAGKHFDPDIIDAFISSEKQFIEILSRFKD